MSLICYSTYWFVPKINERKQGGCTGERGTEGDTGANSGEQTEEWRKLHHEKLKKLENTESFGWET